MNARILVREIAKLILMRLQADDSLRADVRIVDDACRQIEPVTGVQGQLFSQVGQAKGDAALHHIDDLGIGMGMRGINVKGTV